RFDSSRPPPKYAACRLPRLSNPASHPPPTSRLPNAKMLAQVCARANLGEVGRPCEGEGGGMDVRTVKDLCQRLDELGTILELMEASRSTLLYIVRHPTRGTKPSLRL